MMETPHNRDRSDEMDIGDLLRELYRWKRVISGITLLLGLVVAGYTLTIPNSYESATALIIREAQSAITENKSPALSVETLQTLTESTEITWALFEKLWEKQALESFKDSSLEKMDEFIKFQDSLGTELKKKQARDPTLLPILVLRASAQSPVDAQAVANEWANIVVDRSREIYSDGVTVLDSFISDVYTQSNEALTKYEQAVADKRVEANLTLKKIRVNAIKDNSHDLEKSIFDLGNKIDVNDSFIEHGRYRISEQTFEGMWIGNLAEYWKINNVEPPIVKEDLSPKAREIIAIVEEKANQVESLRAYKKDINILGLRSKFAHYQQNLTRILEEKARVDDELPSMQAALDALSNRMEAIPEKIVLNKAITDDALWNAHINNTLPNDKDFDPLRSETLNPVYNSSMNKFLELLAQVETLKGSAVQLSKSAETTTLLLANLDSDIDFFEREIERRNKVLGNVEVMFTFFSEDYEGETLMVERLNLENIRMLEEIGIRETMRMDIAKEVMDLEEEIVEYDIAINLLVREVEKTKGVREALASKAEEVALLRVSVENASRTGTAILYKAQANPLKVAPARSKIVLAAMLVVITLCIIFVCSAKLIRSES